MEKEIKYTKEAIEYLAKLSQGGMRDALTMLDKCLAYSDELTLENVTKALGIANYDVMANLLSAYDNGEVDKMVNIINEVYMSGYDLKQFIKSFTDFVLDLNKYKLGAKEYVECPMSDAIKFVFEDFSRAEDELLTSLIKLQADIKWDTNPKSRVEVWCITGE